MLVRLIGLPDISKIEQRLQTEENIIFRRPIAPEKSIVVNWVKNHFSENWASEVDVSFQNKPVSCFLAQRENEILGFSCYESTAKNFFGPTGILENERNKSIGKILLVKSLEALKELGYTYAIIGGVGPAGYYKKTVNAEIIEGSEHSIYQNMLKQKDA